MSDRTINITVVRPGQTGPAGAPGATTWDGLTGTANHIPFGTAPTDVPTTEGTASWNATDGTLDIIMKGGNVTQQVGQEILIRVVNKSGSTIANGKAVYISGAQGNRIAVGLADNTDADTDHSIGIATEDIANNQEGFVTAFGLVRDLDTSAWSEGDELWLSTSGNLVNTPPAAPAKHVRMGYVVNDHAVNGSIFVTTHPGRTLGEVDGVSITSPANGDLLRYDSVSGLWENSPESDLPISDATQAALDDKADAALQVPDDPYSKYIIYRDTAAGDDQTLVLSGTRNMVPGPGVWTVGQASNQSIARFESGRLRLTNYPYASGAVQINAPATVLAAGMTARFHIVPSFHRGFQWAKTKIGWGHTTNNGPGRRGCISLEKNQNENNIRIWISNGASNTDDGLYNAGYGILVEGEEAILTVRHKTLQHQEYFIQIARSGCPINSGREFKLGETFMDLSGGITVYPYMAHEHSGVSELREFTVYSQWEPSVRANFFDYSRTLQGTHIPSLARDPATGLVIMGWNRGLTHVGQGLSEIRGNVRLASGAWTTPTTWMAAPSSPAGQSINSISVVGNALWLMYWKTANGAVEGGTLYRRTITINPSDGAVTLGTETSLGISGTQNLSFAPIITLPSGRLMMPMHKGDGSPALNSYVAHSDDSGITWTVNAIGGSIPAGMNALVEASLVIESDGAVGQYIRNQSGSIAYCRCTNPDAATPTWTTPIKIEGIPDPYSRSRVIKRADGQILLIGNDSKVYRRDVTIWALGDNGAVLGKTFIADWNPINATDAVSQLSYPDILDDGEDIVLAWTCQESGGVNLACGIRQMTMRYTRPVALEAGGSGTRDKPKDVDCRPVPPVATYMPYSTAPTPDLSKNNNLVEITLTASTAVIGAPLHPLPWQPLKVVITQGGAGGFVPSSWNSIYEFNGWVPTYQTAALASDVFWFIFNPRSQKWVRVASSGVSQTLVLAKTITPSGTTGARTINNATGSVNFAAAATSLVVTNSLCTVNSVVIPSLGTVDATAELGAVVVANGSFTINMKTAPTAETKVFFLLTN